MRWALKQSKVEYRIKVLEAQDYPAKTVLSPLSLKRLSVPQVKVELSAAFLNDALRSGTRCQNNKIATANNNERGSIGKK